MLEIDPKLLATFPILLGPKVQKRLVELTEQHAAKLVPLLKERSRFQEKMNQGQVELDFLPRDTVVADAEGTKLSAGQIREGDWKLNAHVPVRRDLIDRKGLEGTGPFLDMGMAISALNATTAHWMADWEDAMGDKGDQIYQAFQNTTDLIGGKLMEYRHPTKGKTYKLQKRNLWPTLIARYRGLALKVKKNQMTYANQDIPATIADMVLYAVNNHAALKENGSGVYFYGPKLQSWQEALWVEQVLRDLEKALRLNTGEIKVYLLNERPEFALQQEEIMWVMRERLVGTNVGRWDYLSGHIVVQQAKPHKILPDPHTLTMKAPFMTYYSQRNIALNNRRGGYAVGGMATAMPNPTHPEVTPVALEAIRQDKRRERQMGYRWSWTATPAPDYVDAGQSELLKEDAELERMTLPVIDYSLESRDKLFEYPSGEATEKGMRLALYYATEYMFGQQQGNNAVAIEDPDTHIRHMNDFATFEIFWHWLWTLHRHGRMSLAVLERLVAGEVERVRKAYFGGSTAGYAASKWPSVFHIVKRLVVHPTMLPYGSHVLLAVVDEDDEAKRKAIIDQFLG